MPTLFDPLTIGAIAAPNRILMAPLTRNRASAGQVPNELMRDYYVQRAAAGLIISEATQISPSAQGYLATPGIHDEAQVAGWRVITDAVHAAGGRIVCQLWHVGRISHVSLQPGGVAPVSSTARAAAGQTYTANGFEAVSTPRALAADELPGIVDDYRRATANALRAGFDGVEIHAANGYLLEQFLRDSINDRSDAYGGSIANRCRFPLDVVRAVAEAAGPERTGIRLSPVTPVNDAAQDSDAAALYGHFVSAFAALRLAYVHVVEGTTGGARDGVAFDYDALRRAYTAGHPAGAWIVNNGYDRALALDKVASGKADAVAFGRPFIANPDLVARLVHDWPLAEPDRATLYGGGAAGYVDYPVHGGA